MQRQKPEAMVFKEASEVRVVEEDGVPRLPSQRRSRKM